MQTAIPETGKTYVSQEDPALTLYVEAVEAIEKDEFGGVGFIVTCRTLKDHSSIEVPCCEILDDEWASFRFVQAAA